MILLLIILVVFVYNCYNEVFKRTRYYRLLSDFPALGLELPVIGSAWKFAGDSEALMNAVARVINRTIQLGGAARLYLFTAYYVVLCDAHDAAFALKTCLEKDYLYKFLRTFSGNGSAFVSGPIAKERRAVLVPSFHPKLLFSFVNIFWDESVNLCEELAPHASRGPFSLEKYLLRYIHRSVVRSGVDISNGDINCDEFSNIIKSWDILAKDRLVTIWKHPDFIYRHHSQYEEANKVLKFGQHFARKILNNRIKEIKNKRLSEESFDPEGKLHEKIFDSIIHSHLKDEEKIEEILIVIIGTDLATLSIGFTLMLLASYPAVQDRAYKEIQDIFDTDRPIAKEDLSRLNYLELVIKESMRLFPPVPVIARKVVKEITLPSGKIIPAGSGLFAAILGIHKNPKYWGPDADCFDPDRFSPERIENVPPEAYIPFSFGPRNCVGYKFGQIAMKALSTILRRYKIVGQPADGPVPNIKTKVGIYRRPVDYKIQIVKRC